MLRGGYGIYYDRIILESGAEELVQNDRALTVTQYAGSACNSPYVPGGPSLGACFAPDGEFAPGSPRWPRRSAGPPDGRRGNPGHGAGCASPHVPAVLARPSAAGRNNLLVSADGLHVFATRQIIGHLLRSTDSTSPYVACPGGNVPCTITDPLTGITDNITLIQSQAKSWYDGLIVSVEHRQ